MWKSCKNSIFAKSWVSASPCPFRGIDIHIQRYEEHIIPKCDVNVQSGIMTLFNCRLYADKI